MFILIFFPFIDLNLTPEEYGSISVFDFITYFALLFTLEDFLYFLRRNNIYFFLFSVLTGILFIGCIKSEFIANSFFNFLKFLSVFIYARMLIAECFKDLRFIKVVIRSLKLSCILSILFLLIQLILGTSFSFYSELNPNIYLASDTLRYPSFFQDPQKYGQYLSMLGFLFLMNRENKTTPGILNLMIFILVVLAIFLTGGRAAFLGLSVGFLIFLLFQSNKFRIIAFFCCLAGYLILSNLTEHFSIFNRVEDINTSYEVRNEIWDEGLQIFFEQPLMGIGVGNHHNYILRHSDDGYYIVDDEIVYYGTESGYLQVLIELGLLGFIFTFLLILVPVIEGLKSYMHSRNINIAFLIASVISWMIAFITVNSLGDKRILVALITVLCLLITSKKSPETIHA